MGAVAHLKYYSAWFCPFAHRATLALEHHKAEVEYEWEEALGWERRASADANMRAQSGEPQHENWYHYKSKNLLSVNPLGMVPTLVDNRGEVITESLVSIQYIDQLAKEVALRRGASATTRPALMPGHAVGDAQVRVALEWVHTRLCAPYYTILVRTDPSERLAAMTTLREDLSSFAASRSGTFYKGSTIGAVDIALLPWALRFYVFEHYRGEAFSLDPDLPSNAALRQSGYHEWLEACLNTYDYVKETTPDKERYLKHIGRYADASARSKVANAVRAGRTADNYDDRLDS